MKRKNLHHNHDTPCNGNYPANRGEIEGLASVRGNHTAWGLGNLLIELSTMNLSRSV